MNLLNTKFEGFLLSLSLSRMNVLDYEQEHIEEVVNNFLIHRQRFQNRLRQISKFFFGFFNIFFRARLMLRH